MSILYSPSLGRYYVSGKTISDLVLSENKDDAYEQEFRNMQDKSLCLRYVTGHEWLIVERSVFDTLSIPKEWKKDK